MCARISLKAKFNFAVSPLQPCVMPAKIAVAKAIS
jgi:hypothetical protein